MEIVRDYNEDNIKSTKEVTNMKKMVSMLLAASMATGLLAGCGGA